MTSIRMATLGLLMATGLILPGASAGAAPTSSGTVVDFRCGDADVHVLLSPGGGNKSWSVSDTRVTDGTSYHVKTFEIRIGDFVWSHAYGQRIGQGDPVLCLGRRPVGTSTGFLRIDATACLSGRPRSPGGCRVGP
jgi:hypothetical protein